MKHTIEGDNWYPWSDIRAGRYEYWEKRYNCKLTKKLLEKAVKEGFVKSREVEGDKFSFTVYNEADIITALAWHKFSKVKLDTIKVNANKWFK